jgi:hypothetical protein
MDRKKSPPEPVHPELGVIVGARVVRDRRSKKRGLSLTIRYGRGIAICTISHMDDPPGEYFIKQKGIVVGKDVVGELCIILTNGKQVYFHEFVDVEV